VSWRWAETRGVRRAARAIEVVSVFENMFDDGVLFVDVLVFVFYLDLCSGLRRGVFVG
jgi:hypothetical protein